jgi:hypothetical protein
MTVEARSSRVRPDRQELIRLRTLLLTASLIVISQPFKDWLRRRSQEHQERTLKKVQWTGMGGTIPGRQP